jgi:uncharacterized protein YbbK (DUF523 family)
LAKRHNVLLAILKQDSPSCGTRFIFAEDFKSKLPGQGRTAALLRSNGIAVFGEDQLDEIERELTAAGELAP